MNTPAFYNPEKVGTFFTPRTALVADVERDATVTPSTEDEQRTLLLLIDTQIDFIHADGALSVPGAIEDTRRVIDWIFKQGEKITTIAASLDSHVPIQIFSPSWWVDANGNHPAPYTIITQQALDDGEWKPLYSEEWSFSYVEKLEEQFKKQLMIWPYHTLIGTVGHNLEPSLYEAVVYHSLVRQTEPIFLMKGLIPRTEHYSILEPEVKIPNEPMGDINMQFLKMLTSYDRVYLAGQAKSHCVLETLMSIMRYLGDDPEMIAKFHLLMDCTSSVYHPEIDFDALANETLNQLAKRGLKLLTTQDAV